MTEYQGYRTKTAHDMAVITAAVAEMVDMSTVAHRPTDDFTIKWRDPSPITPLSDMEAMMADIERITERQNRAMRFYSNTWVTRYMAGMPGAL